VALAGLRSRVRTPQPRGGGKKPKGGAMEISRELIVGPKDLDRLSIRCKSCGAELVVSLGALVPGATADRDLKKPDIPTNCPSCNDDWSKVYGVVRNFRAGLQALKDYGVSFRVPAPERERKGE
jgi:hypothetical protein